jgi:pyruvate dehydrogenase E1 component
MRYLKERREALGGSLPRRMPKAERLEVPTIDGFAEFLKGSERFEVSTTMAWVRMLGTLLRNKKIGRHIVPIVPDEARTFGMDPLFREIGIYSPKGQLYDPVDSESLLFYREATDGQILEEGITEAGAMSSFVAAATSYANSGVTMIPFYIY